MTDEVCKVNNSRQEKKLDNRLSECNFMGCLHLCINYDLMCTLCMVRLLCVSCKVTEQDLWPPEYVILFARYASCTEFC